MKGIGRIVVGSLSEYAATGVRNGSGSGRGTEGSRGTSPGLVKDPEGVAWPGQWSRANRVARCRSGSLGQDCLK